MKNFTNKFQLSKTLRFELIPQGNTLENIEKKGLIGQDDRRAESYKKMKKSIDEYHKYFIGQVLSNFKLTNLQDFVELYNEKNSEKKKEDSYIKSLEKVQDDLRKDIAKAFKEGDSKDIFSKLNKKELFTELLENWKKENDDFYFDEEFKNFTTYFTGFNTNRANMYSSDAKSTSIAYRLIHENLPKFLDNIKLYKEALKKGIDFTELEKQLEPLIQGIPFSEVFELNFFNDTLTQNGIDFYNAIIGGYSESNGVKIKGINEFINNQYNQKQDKKNRIPKLKMLYKQILSDRINISFLPEKFENSQDVLDAIENYYKSNLLDYQTESMDSSENVLESLKMLVGEISNYETTKIYLRNDSSLTQISQTLFNDWGIIKSALEYSYLQGITIGKKGLSKKQEIDKEKFLTKQSYYSIAEIEDALLMYKDQNEVLNDLKKETQPVSNYFKNHFLAKKKEGNDKQFDLIFDIEDKYRCIKGILSNDYPQDKDLKSSNNLDTLNIKLFLDSLMEFMHFMKPLALPSDSILDKDEHFYSQFSVWYEQLQLMIPLYNKVRNYATQKPYSEEKFKLNFENSTLLSGWDVNKEEANTSVLFLKDGLYYLGVMDKNHNKVFRNFPDVKTQNVYQKINYKLLPGASKMLPKVFFSDKNISFFNPSDEILNIRNHGSHTKGGKPQEGFDKKDFNLNDCRKMITFFKESINKHPEWKYYGFEFSDTQSYNSIDEFYREVEAQGYNISYTDIDVDYINELVNEGKLYLFKIYSKDFSKYSKGRKNMHTLYWEALFDSQNLKDVVYKLNGQAEIFYRRKSIQYDEIIMKNGHHYKDLKDKFSYPIIKDKRFSENKFQFHVPITLNFKASGGDYINNEVLDYLKENPEVNIIGLDRGERHLIYLSLINQKGEVINDKNGIPIQYSLNEIINEHQGRQYPTDYKSLLNTKEEERANARENWGTIENIKDLKEGYISQVVHKIARLMVEYNAIVVMEDLNFGFKKGRFKVEKQVYQKLEKMLIDKLNYLIFKEKDAGELGGIYHALQLTNKFKSFKEMGKQNGFLFYVPAWNTSKIDPTTGFVNLFNTKYETLEKAKDFFSKFKDIRFNSKENYFEFEFDYNSFTEKGQGTKTDWTVCTYGNRILTFRNPRANNNWDYETINLTEAFIKIFKDNGLDYNQNLKEQIISKGEANFYKDLMYCFKLTLQMRNSNSKTDEDYLISPVKNRNNEFFDTNNAKHGQPKDADANGAYHIAKKGLWLLNQINHYDETDNWKKLKLAVSNKEWLQFVQKS